MSKTNTIESHNSESVKDNQSGPNTSVSETDSKTVEESNEITESKVQPVNTTILKQLALQLEYYFSMYNLSRDTYVQTLRKLNDGCVPVRILANFGKVKAIVALDVSFIMNEEARIQAILETIRQGYTESLRIHSVDAISGRIVSSSMNETPIPGKSILAIGTVTREPLDVNPLATSPLVSRTITNPGIPTANTIILREVPTSVTEEEVRILFSEILDCPPITSVTQDVANCWFVSLETDARELMMNIMMQLRTMKLGGEYVMARLKASSTSMADIDPYHPVFAPFQNTGPLRSSQGSEGTRRKKKKSRTKKNRNKKFQSSVSTDSQSASASGSEKNTPPSLSVDQFPSLLDEKKVEWETPPGDGRDHRKGDDDDSKSFESAESPKSGKLYSDGASTATTTSSSLESIPKKIMSIGGYAAALMKPAPPKVDNTKETTSIKKVDPSREFNSTIDSSNSSYSIGTSANTKKSNDVEKTAKVSAPVAISGWGQRRSFADILRQDKVDAPIASS